MKIGIVTSSFPRFEKDLSGRFVFEFAESLVARGHSIEVLAPDCVERDLSFTPAAFGVRWVRYLAPRTLQRTFHRAGAPENLSASMLAWFGVPSYAAALRRTIAARTSGWDALVSHWAFPHACIAAPFFRRKPHLGIFHSADFFALSKTPFRGAWARRIVRDTSSLLFVRERQKREFLDWMPDTCEEKKRADVHAWVSPMGITARPASDRSEARAKLGIRSFAFMTMSRLVPIKRIDHILSALAKLRREELPDFEFLIAGDGPERPRLQRLARELQVPTRFLGVVSGQKKNELLAAADVFVIASEQTQLGRTEGVPVSLLEAMRAGVPCVATNTGGNADVIGDGRTGLLIEPRDLSAALRRIHDDVSLRKMLGKNAATATTPLEWPKLAEKIEHHLFSARSGARLQARSTGTPSRAQAD